MTFLGRLEVNCKRFSTKKFPSPNRRPKLASEKFSRPSTTCTEGRSRISTSNRRISCSTPATWKVTWTEFASSRKKSHFLSAFPSADGLKLCDFGFARAIEGTKSICEIQGTPDFVAPEIVQYEPLSLKTDIWSIGVLAYVLLTGYSPFGGDDKQETFCNITQCNLTFPDELFEGVSDDAIDFMKSTLRLKPW